MTPRSGEGVAPAKHQEHFCAIWGGAGTDESGPEGSTPAGHLAPSLRSLPPEHVFTRSRPENAVTEFRSRVSPRGGSPSPAGTGPGDSSPLRGPFRTCRGKPHGQSGTRALVSGNLGSAPGSDPPDAEQGRLTPVRPTEQVHAARCSAGCRTDGVHPRTRPKAHPGPRGAGSVGQSKGHPCRWTEGAARGCFQTEQAPARAGAPPWRPRP